MPGDAALNPRGSLSGFSKVRVWLMIGVAAVGFGGFFAVYSYIAEVVTRVAELPAGAVPWHSRRSARA